MIAKHEASRGREEGGCEAGRVMSLEGSGKVQKMGGLELEDQDRHERVNKAREEGWQMDIIEDTACEGGKLARKEGAQSGVIQSNNGLLLPKA